MNPARWWPGVALAGLLAVSACAGGGSQPGLSLEVRGSALNSSVAVTVVDVNGAPQPGIGVNAFDTNGNAAGFQTTDTQGVAAFSLADASYVFETADFNYDFASATCTTPTCTSVTITVTQPVAVSVVDPNGAPQANVGVMAEDASGNDVNFVYTDDNGAASIYVPQGTFQFVVLEGNAEFDSASCAVPGCTTATITLPHPVTVTVTDTNGTPQANVGVVAEDAQGNNANYGTTDDTGSASIYVPNGTYQLGEDLRLT
jgi:hypothetical protein